MLFRAQYPALSGPLLKYYRLKIYNVDKNKKASTEYLFTPLTDKLIKVVSFYIFTTFPDSYLTINSSSSPILDTNFKLSCIKV